MNGVKSAFEKLYVVEYSFYPKIIPSYLMIFKALAKVFQQKVFMQRKKIKCASRPLISFLIAYLNADIQTYFFN